MHGPKNVAKIDHAKLIIDITQPIGQSSMSVAPSASLKQKEHGLDRIYFHDDNHQTVWP